MEGTALPPSSPPPWNLKLKLAAVPYLFWKQVTQYFYPLWFPIAGLTLDAKKTPSKNNKTLNGGLKFSLMVAV